MRQNSDQQLSVAKTGLSVLDEGIAGVPAIFGKLVWLSSLGVSGSADKYEEPRLEQMVPCENIHRALREQHRSVFGV